MSADLRPAAFRVVSHRPDSTRFLEAVVSGPGYALIFLVLFTAGFGGLSWLWLRPETFNPSTSGGSIFVALRMLVLLCLAFLAAGALARTARWLAGRRPSGRVTLNLAGEPSIRNGLRGEVRLPWRLQPAETAVLVLTCEVGARFTGTGVTPYRWSWEQAVDGAACQPGTETRVPVSFTLPRDAPPSGTYVLDGDAVRVVRWQLWVAIHPDGPFVMVFSIPVMADAGMPAFLPRALDESRQSEPSTARPASTRIDVAQPVPGHTEYRLPRLMAWGFLVAWTMVTAPAWIVLPWLAWQDARDWPGNLGVMLVILVLFSGAPLAVLLSPRRLTVAANGVTICRLLLRPSRFHLRRVRAAEARPGPTPDVRRRVKLVLDDGSTRMVHECLSMAEARWLAADINRALDRARTARSAMFENQ